MDFNLPLNIVYDRTLNNCPECDSDNTSLLLSIPVGIESKVYKVIKKPEEKCKDCGFKSEYRFKLLNSIKRREQIIDKILDK